MKITRQPLQPLSVAIDKSACLACSTHESGQAHRLSWRRTIDWLTSPAFRLHRYRNVHTQMLRGALCTIDCGQTQYGSEDAGNE